MKQVIGILIATEMIIVFMSGCSSIMQGERNNSAACQVLTNNSMSQWFVRIDNEDRKDCCDHASDKAACEKAWPIIDKISVYPGGVERLLFLLSGPATQYKTDNPGFMQRGLNGEMERGDRNNLFKQMPVQKKIWLARGAIDLFVRIESVNDVWKGNVKIDPGMIMKIDREWNKDIPNEYKDTGAEKFVLSEFMPDQYNAGSVIRLCDALNSDSLIKGGCSKLSDTGSQQWNLNKINKLLTRPDLFTLLTGLKGAPSERLAQLQQVYASTRSESDLKRLNRATLEEFYPNITAKSVAQGNLYSEFMHAFYAGDIESAMKVIKSTKIPNPINSIEINIGHYCREHNKCMADDNLRYSRTSNCNMWE